MKVKSVSFIHQTISPLYFIFVELWLDDGEIGEFDTPDNITTLFFLFVELWC
jgi:hypothetical protein